MKLQDWKDKYDQEHPNRSLRAINIRDLMNLEFDNQPERSKREDSIPKEARKGFKQFLDETFDRRMEIVEQLQKERDAVL